MVFTFLVSVINPILIFTFSFNEGDAFIGYQSDTIASVVLHSTELLTSDGNKLSIKEVCKMQYIYDN